jgi:hypothetical protein
LGSTNPNPHNSNEELHDKENLEAESKVIDEMEEEHFKQHGTVPPDFHQDFFALRAQAETYEAAPQVLPSPAANVEAETKKGKGKGSATIKATRAKKNHNLGVTFAGEVDQDGCVHRSSSARDRYKSYGGEALRTLRQTFAPKGAKPKQAMETPVRPAADQKSHTKETKIERARRLTAQVLGKY